MTKRVSLSKKTRFEVFKRDGFKCQYCGKSAPDVILEVDHILPVCNGGDNEMLNLVTSCFDCNRGKSGNELSDHAVVTKQIEQLQEINERREQLEMIANWRQELLSLNQAKADILHTELCRRYGVKELTNKAKIFLLQIATKHKMEDIFVAIDSAFAKANTTPAKSFQDIGKILSNSKYTPEQQRLMYCRGILRNRLNGATYNDLKAITLLTNARKAGYDLIELDAIVRRVNCWGEFVCAVSTNPPVKEQHDHTTALPIL